MIKSRMLQLASLQAVGGFSLVSLGWHTMWQTLPMTVETQWKWVGRGPNVSTAEVEEHEHKQQTDVTEPWVQMLFSVFCGSPIVLEKNFLVDMKNVFEMEPNQRANPSCLETMIGGTNGEGR